MGGKTDGVNFVFYAMLKELDSAVGFTAVEYQYSWLTSRPRSSISILKLDSSLNTSTYFSFVCLSKFPASHSSPSTLSVHPVFDQAKVAFSSVPTAACHPIRWEYPLYMYIGGSTLPSAETHSMTVEPCEHSPFGRGSFGPSRPPSVRVPVSFNVKALPDGIVVEIAKTGELWKVC